MDKKCSSSRVESLKEEEQTTCCSNNPINTRVKDECYTSPSMIEEVKTTCCSNKESGKDSSIQSNCCSGSGKAADPVNINLDGAIKVVALLLILPGWLTLWFAVLSDTGAALIVILNALRLLRGKG